MRAHWTEGTRKQLFSFDQCKKKTYAFAFQRNYPQKETQIRIEITWLLESILIMQGFATNCHHCYEAHNKYQTFFYLLATFTEGGLSRHIRPDKLVLIFDRDGIKSKSTRLGIFPFNEFLIVHFWRTNKLNSLKLV